ncbi:DUF7144 family membrane protein [Micromonospora echinofusca]|uniref:DUF7144 domain-containing protein n=1 Tax=Micromonospora echinofusca TaxID=47858 RepID=A0ABS3VRN1_MICEH|nr:hypothetical protein [Micromonospora echinofusca]MBO4207165.1 hypothetical protein [Micromonospora echinofusca]
MAAVRDGGRAPGRPALLAGSLVGLAGLLDLLAGLGRLASEPYVLITERGIHHLHTSGWIALHLVIAAITTAASLMIMTDRRWTAPLGSGVVGVSIVVDLLFLPYEPLRALLAIGLEAGAVLILVRHGRLWPRLPG